MKALGTCKVNIKRKRGKIIGFETTEECVQLALEVVAKELLKEKVDTVEITEETIE